VFCCVVCGRAISFWFYGLCHRANPITKGNIVLRTCRALQVCKIVLYCSLGCSGSHDFLCILLFVCCVLLCFAWNYTSFFGFPCIFCIFSWFCLRFVYVLREKYGIRRFVWVFPVFFVYFVGFVCDLCVCCEKRTKQHIAPIHTTHIYIYIHTEIL